MYMSTHYIQNVVPKKCAIDYVKMCSKNGKFSVQIV